ncbi:copper resistance protein NlpE [Janthinobacterium kumbetense]|uniref:Copper resistance protein NlpE n=1 Tax=Janthinobacterium kumbetense TaxID=2950280 RepID=A0ABT0WMX1_9BURK|nr:copper resistance protein NlpE [Janthinobacterium kumbetense]MCM2564799.1 copper resistance protein NlpE [Janthinobacterium kumbetense]
MKKSLSRLLACAALAWSFSASAADSAPATLPGHYYLQGVMETGSELLLKKDGTFEWMLSYGNTDEQASGEWRVAGDVVTLEAGNGGKEPQFRVFEEAEMRIQKPAEAGLWVAIVGYPQVGPMPGVEVKFEAQSGKTATAVSVANGDAIVRMPASERWVRAGLRRQGSKADYQWLAVPPARAQERIAAFAVTDPQWLRGQAFQKLALRVVEGGLKVDDADNGLARGLYAKAASKQ